MKELIVGLFLSRKEANSALKYLKMQGINKDEIFIITKEEQVTVLRSTRRHITGEGALTGGILGGLAGLLVASIPVLLPGMGVLIIGPLVILVGFAVGAVIGGILGTIVDLGVSISQMRRYKRRIRAGGALIAAPVDEEKVEEVQELLEAYNAEEQAVIPYKVKREVIGVRPARVS